MRNTTPDFIDARGSITNLLLGASIQSVSEIVSARGAVRANHYHRQDAHHAYVVSGSVLYFERPLGSTEIPTPKRYEPGDMFYTPSMVEHAMLFAEDTVILTFAPRLRDHVNHESDVVRVEFVTPAIASKWVP